MKELFCRLIDLIFTPIIVAGFLWELCVRAFATGRERVNELGEYLD